MSRAPLLPADEAWESLRAQLEWRRGFGLFFLFAPHQGAAAALRERITSWLQIHTLRLRRLKCESPQYLKRDLIPALFDEATGAPPQTPFWIEAEEKPFDPDWNLARSVFLGRLNEQRGGLEAEIHGPVIVVLPLEFRSETRRIAPDLWHVRVWSGELSAAEIVSSSDDKWQLSADVSHQRPQALSLKEGSETSKSEAAVSVWRRLLASSASNTDRIQLSVGFEAFDLAFEAYRFDDARAIATAVEAIARGRSISGGPAALRDLSVSLDKVGGVDQALGQLESARTAYAESLTLRRKINAAIGETPQGLFDVVVVLLRLAGIAKLDTPANDGSSVRAEALALLVRLRTVVGTRWAGYDIDKLIEGLESS